MNELLFNAMDILKQTRDLVGCISPEVCRDLTVREKQIYLSGVANTLNALEGLLTLDEEPVVHVPGLHEIEEMDIAELEERFLN